MAIRFKMKFGDGVAPIKEQLREQGLCVPNERDLKIIQDCQNALAILAGWGVLDPMVVNIGYDKLVSSLENLVVPIGKASMRA
jgi:hypothetical protein